MNYPPQDAPPFDVPAELSLPDARRLFDWFVSRADQRRAVLIQQVSRSGGPAAELDYSLASLVPLWAWAAARLKTTKMSEFEAAQVVAETPAWLRATLPTLETLSDSTMSMLSDLAYYVAEVLRRERPEVTWTLCTDRSHGPYLEPILGHLAIPVVPRDMIASAAWKAIEGPVKKTDLADRCRYILKHVAMKPKKSDAKSAATKKATAAKKPVPKKKPGARKKPAAKKR